MTVAHYPPIARQEYLDRLEAFRPEPDVTEDLWALVHDETQGNLAILDDDVCGRVQNVGVQSGRTKGKAFHLFTYRMYTPTDGAVDPVVVGMTFQTASGGVTIEADVSGEQLGDVILALPSQTVPESREELIRTVQNLSKKLIQSSAAIAAALGNPSRKVE